MLCEAAGGGSLRPGSTPAVPAKKVVRFCDEVERNERRCWYHPALPLACPAHPSMRNGRQLPLPCPLDHIRPYPYDKGSNYNNSKFRRRHGRDRRYYGNSPPRHPDQPALDKAAAHNAAEAAVSNNMCDRGGPHYMVDGGLLPRVSYGIHGKRIINGPENKKINDSCPQTTF